jgi:hypothetical protein
MINNNNQLIETTGNTTLWSRLDEAQKELQDLIVRQKNINAQIAANRSDFIAYWNSNRTITKRQEVVEKVKNSDGTVTVHRSLKEEITYGQ